jgi:sulfhydrogenase subunit beta (sulfur reductase)
MMDEKILLKKDMKKLYENLSKEYNFYAPVNEKGQIIFEKIKEPDKIDLEYLNSKMPPKEVLFPRKEVLFEYRYEGKEVIIEERKDLDEKNIIFGIRPCDAASFNLLDTFFATGKCEDTIYATKRENTVLIGIGCNSPRLSCFCTSVNGHPFKEEDMDVFLVDLGEKYLVKAVTEKGTTIMRQLLWLSNANKADLKNAKELSQTAEEAISTEFNFNKVTALLDSNFDHEVWREISENCIGCGSCTFLCPTCTCFDVIDENDEYNNRGRRVRIWDTCQSTLYTLETSGHNPRPEKTQRCRNRVMHKFSYYPSNYDLIGCVGCGRCIQVCPVNNELRVIINKILEIEKDEKEKEVVIDA